MNGNNNFNIILDKQIYKKIPQTQQYISNYNLVECPANSRIEDIRTLTEFRNKTFNGYARSQVITALEKDIIAEKPENALFWGVQLIVSGYIDKLLNKLISISAKHINIQNPSLPEFIKNRKDKLTSIMSPYITPHVSNDILILRNIQEVRNIYAELMTILSISRKRKLEKLYKINKEDFIIENFKRKIDASATDANAVIKDNDPNEIKIVAGEIIFNLVKRNSGKAIYWLSWLYEWDRLNVKQYGKFEIGMRYVKNIDAKNASHYTLLIWEIIFYVMRMPNVRIADIEIKQINILYDMFIDGFTTRNAPAKINIIIWAFKYMCAKIDWNIKLIEREHVLFQAVANINIIYINLKKYEMKFNRYLDDKFNTIVINTVEPTREQQLKREYNEKLRKLKSTRSKTNETTEKSLRQIDTVFKIDNL